MDVVGKGEGVGEATLPSCIILSVLCKKFWVSIQETDVVFAKFDIKANMVLT